MAQIQTQICPLFLNYFTHFVSNGISELNPVVHTNPISPQTIIHYELVLNSTDLNLYFDFPSKFKTGIDFLVFRIENTKDISNVVMFLSRISVSRHNPDYVIFQMSQVSEFHDETSRKFFKILYKFGITSKYLVHLTNQESLHLLNLINSQTLLPVKDDNPDSLDVLWFSSHQNLQEYDVHCAAYEADFVLDELSDRLNFSCTNDINSPDNFGALKRSHLAVDEIGLKFGDPYLIQKWVWSPYAAHLDFFDFTVFAPRDEELQRMTVLLRPFQTHVCMGTCSHSFIQYIVENE